ncbi:MAG TPA: DUF192 domain-containing protein [Deinococcales bacterium]|nr:DUF192 domain-containing protein [Deinococcales bacterium]
MKVSPRLLVLALVPVAAVAALVFWPRGVAGSNACFASEFKMPAGVKAMDFGCGVAHLTSASSTVDVPVEIADTPDQSERGLMYRTRIPANAGMVFRFEAPTDTAFWMKDTLIPLAIAFYNQRGVITDILEMKPCAADPCETYTPASEYIGAMEANAGFFARQRIKVGDSFSLTVTKPAGPSTR